MFDEMPIFLGWCNTGMPPSGAYFWINCWIYSRIEVFEIESTWLDNYKLGFFFRVVTVTYLGKSYKVYERFKENMTSALLHDPLFRWKHV